MERHENGEAVIFWRKLVIDLSIMTAIGVVLAVVGPFGSFALPFSQRLVYWLGLGWAGYAFYRPVGGLASRLAVRLHLPEPLLWLLATVIATVPMTVVVELVRQIPGPLHMPRLDLLIATFGYVFVIGASVTALFYALGSRTSALADDNPPTGESGAPRPDERPGARFLERLPPAIAERLLALEMEDHYVRAHGLGGSALVLMRMCDALAELEDVDGQLVHRSWWVARAAVESVQRDGRNVRLVLANGVVAPVARDAVGRVKEAGWL